VDLPFCGVFSAADSVKELSESVDNHAVIDFISEREFTFAICYRPSVCRLSVCRLSVTLVRPTQAVEIFGNISAAFGTLAIH